MTTKKWKAQAEVEFDVRNNVGYIKLLDGGRGKAAKNFWHLKRGVVDRTARISDKLLIDFDKSGRVLGIELLDLAGVDWRKLSKVKDGHWAHYLIIGNP